MSNWAYHIFSRTNHSNYRLQSFSNSNYCCCWRRNDIIFSSFSGFYTGWLFPPAVLGLCVFLYGLFTLAQNVIAQEVCSEYGRKCVFFPLDIIYENYTYLYFQYYQVLSQWIMWKLATEPDLLLHENSLPIWSPGHCLLRRIHVFLGKESLLSTACLIYTSDAAGG